MKFYRLLFAALCFASFAWAFFAEAPLGYVGALAFGALSRTAARKKWRDPWFVKNDDADDSGETGPADNV